MRLLRSASFFKPAKAILVPGMYFLGFSAGYLSVPPLSNRKQGSYCHNDNVRLGRISAVATRVLHGGCRQQREDVPRYSKRVFSSQVMPLLTLAAVYEYPSALPVWRPKTPWRLGPTL